jgi:O-antigen/teichoic acid export membrane protein
MALLISRVLGALAQAGILIVLARGSTPAEFGFFGAVVAFGAVMTGVLGFGLPTRALLISGQDARTRIALLCAGDGLGVLIALSCMLSAIFIRDGAPSVLVAAMIYSGVEFAISIHLNVLFGEQNLIRAEVLMLSRRLVPLILVVVSVALLPSLVMDALAVGSAIALVISISLTHSRINLVSFTAIRGLVKNSRSYWFTNVGSMLQQLDATIVSVFMGPASAAGFVAGFRFASPVHLVTTLLVARIMPTVKVAAETKPRILRNKYFRLGLVYSILIAGVSPILSWGVVLALGGAYQRFLLVILVLFLNSALSVINQLLIAWTYARSLGERIIPTVVISSTLIGLMVVVCGALISSLEIAALGTISIQILLLITLVSFQYLQWRKK